VTQPERTGGRFYDSVPEFTGSVLTLHQYSSRAKLPATCHRHRWLAQAWFVAFDGEGQALEFRAFVQAAKPSFSHSSRDYSQLRYGWCEHQLVGGTRSLTTLAYGQRALGFCNVGSGGSDHAPFAAIGCASAVLFLSSRSLTYHSPNDQAGRSASARRNSSVRETDNGPTPVDVTTLNDEIRANFLSASPLISHKFSQCQSQTTTMSRNFSKKSVTYLSSLFVGSMEEACCSTILPTQKAQPVFSRWVASIQVTRILILLPCRGKTGPADRI